MMEGLLLLWKHFYRRHNVAAGAADNAGKKDKWRGRTTAAAATRLVAQSVAPNLILPKRQKLN